MKLGDLRLDNPFVQAPLSGVTDAAFRTIARRFHGGLLFTEMVSAEALCRGGRRTLQMATVLEAHHPCVLQLVGRVPARMAEATRVAVRLGADAVDVNAACPEEKVLRAGGGGALLRDRERLRAIVEAVVEAANVPISVKLRIGHDRDDSVALARLVEEAGASWLTLHGRTVRQKFSGSCDRAIIARAVGEVSIPVVANGDARDEAGAIELLRATGGAGAMLGRATRGRPDLPGTAFGLLRGGRFERMGKDTLRRTMLDHAGLLCEMLGEVRGMRRFRKHAHWYLRAAGARPDPREAHSLETVAELRALLERCLGP